MWFRPRRKGGPMRIPVSGGITEGDLNIAPDSDAVVVFAHGSVSSRHSSRNKYVAGVLNDSGISTLMLDLLTAEEEAIDQNTAHLRFNIDLLAERLINATDWLLAEHGGEFRHIGYFGASTGAAAALVAAAKRRDVIEAVVSRGGRPDLAGPWLSAVHSPTLLIVGEDDGVVVDLNRHAAAEITAEHGLEIIPGAGHLFEEPGTLEKAAHAARLWFERYLLDKTHVA